jgi:flagellar L-ring protein precursor FlgH
MKGRVKKRLCFFLLFICLWTGCATRPDFSPGDQQIYTPVPSGPAPARGSIWSGESSANMLFADKKARYVNDIVTIIINESSSGGNKAPTNTSRSSDASAGVDAFLGLEQSILSRNANMGSKIEIGGASSSNLKGTGNTTRGGQLEGTITARVVRVLDNGNLVIEGRRQLTINEEDQYIIMTGVIRPEDITTNNCIYSQYIADARIVYTGNGIINDKMRPGWATRIVDWVWPF